MQPEIERRKRVAFLLSRIRFLHQVIELAAGALAQADPHWLAGLITRRVPLGQWADAYNRQPGDIKTVLDFPRQTP